MQMLQIQKMIAEVITENRALSAGFLFRGDYLFAPMQTANVFDAIVVKIPQDASCSSPQYPAARRPPHDCISVIKQYGLTKAIVIADELSFLRACPSLTDLVVIPADKAAVPFDFTPLLHRCMICRICAISNANWRAKTDRNRLAQWIMRGCRICQRS